MKSALLDFIFPRLCHLCELKLALHEEYVCTRCLTDLPRTHFHTIRMNGMEQRFAGIFPFTRATGHFFYTRSSPLATLVHDFKYHGFPNLARYLGRIMARELYTTSFFADTDIILPIPMHYWKRAKRGYNQAHLLALGIADITEMPLSDALRARRPHKTQTALSLEKRRNNLNGIFRVTDPDNLKGRDILLVDDVCTTGSTLTEAAETLWKEASPRALTLLTLGVTV
ncbi:MAG: ComF family protein [Muribaculaceae bacterium]|nr:ComF family protein [Muribaculaceae bacterium]